MHKHQSGYNTGIVFYIHTHTKLYGCWYGGGFTKDFRKYVLYTNILPEVKLCPCEWIFLISKKIVFVGFLVA